MNNYFLKMIQQLWEKEEIMLYGNIMSITDEEIGAVGAFLKKAYNREALDYPHQTPEFDYQAAQWAAKTIYLAAQLLLYRENKETDLPKIILAYERKITPAAILSVDLCLRFLPALIKELKLIDQEDSLIEILEEILKDWHYSGVNHPMNEEDLNFEIIENDPCLLQLYCDRVIKNKNQKLANHKALINQIKANLGNHKNQLWNISFN